MAEGECEKKKSYEVGDVVSYDGYNYKCVQAHISQEDWEPSNIRALWEKQCRIKTGVVT